MRLKITAERKLPAQALKEKNKYSFLSKISYKNTDNTEVTQDSTI